LVPEEGGNVGFSRGINRSSIALFSEMKLLPDEKIIKQKEGRGRME